MSEIKTIRKKYVNSTLVNKTCSKCHKEYPRTAEFFYQTTAAGSKLKGNGWQSICITCDNERTAEWRRKNKTKKKIADTKYFETEKGFFSQMFGALKRSVHYDPTEFPDPDSLIQHWHRQKEIHGTKCPATGVELTMIKGKGKPTLTNISKDRILCFKNYTKQNLIFTTWKFNNDKNATTPKMARTILRITKERFGDEY